jgi:hypothetical protein
MRPGNKSRNVLQEGSDMIFLKIIIAWTLLGFILSPIVGGFLRRNRRSTSVRADQ